MKRGFSSARRYGLVGELGRSGAKVGRVDMPKDIVVADIFVSLGRIVPIEAAISNCLGTGIPLCDAPDPHRHEGRSARH